jgi:isopenicillin-N N-acyltransferase like protein
VTQHFRSTAMEPTARGREFGARHAERIREGVSRYQALFERAAARSLDLHQLGRDALMQVAGFAPALHAEMRGLADGAEIDVDWIGVLNARTEILAALRVPARGECSAVVHVEPYSSAATAVQTWDWYTDFADQWLVWEIPHADGSFTTTLTEYGIVGKIGVNSRRLGLLFNILHHERDCGDMGVPVHVLARALLDSCGDLNDALKLIQATPVSASSSLTLIQSAEGGSAAVSAEVFPGGPGLVFPGPDGLLVKTNHFLSAPACEYDTEPGSFPDTLIRHDLLTRRLRDPARRTTADVLGAMNSHIGTIGAVCCHPNPNLSSLGQYATLATVTLDVARGALRAVPGGPCHIAQNVT